MSTRSWNRNEAKRAAECAPSSYEWAHVLAGHLLDAISEVDRLNHEIKMSASEPLADQLDEVTAERDALRAEVERLKQQRGSLYERLTQYEDVDPLTFRSESGHE